jgi:hypothetical protein
MSKPTVSAAGGAMPAEGQPPREREAYIEGFLRLKSLRLSIEETLDEMSDILDAVDADAPDRDPSRELLGVVDDINEVRCILEAAWMAAESISELEERAAMQTLLRVA